MNRLIATRTTERFAESPPGRSGIQLSAPQLVRAKLLSIFCYTYGFIFLYSVIDVDWGCRPGCGLKMQRRRFHPSIPVYLVSLRYPVTMPNRYL